MARFVALLRGINVGGNRKVPMVDLRQLCEKAGCTQVSTYIQSGNVVFSAPGTASAVESKLEKAVLARFGFAVDVLVRSKADWIAYEAKNPFAEMPLSDARLVHLLLSKAAPKPDAVLTLRPRAAPGERIEAADDVLWIFYARGAGTTKLTPALLDRAVGSPVTARNWRTVQEITKLLG